MELAGHRLSLPEVKNDAYVVGAVNDHIVPWPSSYQATRLLGGNVRYILSSGGHIAGIVNPPGPKAWYEAADSNPGDGGRLADCGRQAERLLVGGLDQVGTAARRRPRPAAGDGQRPVPGDRGRARRLRPWLTAGGGGSALLDKSITSAYYSTAEDDPEEES